MKSGRKESMGTVELAPRTLARRHPIGTFFLLSFAISWVLWVPIILIIRLLLPEGQDPGWLMLPMTVGLYAPTIAAIVMTGALEGKAAVKRLLAKFIVWRVGVRWFLAALLLVPVAYLPVMGIYALQGGTLGVIDFSKWYLVLLGPVIALPFYLGEELGWRGYALPKLQRKYSALWSSVIVGALWMVWHVPAFWAPSGTALSGQPVTLLAVGWYLVLLVGVSVLMTWIYNNAEGSVLLMLLFHGMFTGPALFPLFPDMPSDAQATIIRFVVIPVWALALLVIAVFGPRRLSRRRSGDPEEE